MEAQQQLQRPHRAEAIKKMVIDRKAELLGAVSVLALMVGGILLAAKSGAEMAWLPGPAMSLARAAAPSPTAITGDFIDLALANELTSATRLTTVGDGDLRVARALAARIQEFERQDPGRVGRGGVGVRQEKGDEAIVSFMPEGKFNAKGPAHLRHESFALVRQGAQWRIDFDQTMQARSIDAAAARILEADARARAAEKAAGKPKAKQKFDMFSSGKKVQCEKFGVGC